ncbi:STAS domain-containing protein [bacterium]|nr:STAS domain-containing protein [bacterium]
MKLEAKKNGKQLEVVLSGELNTLTAPELSLLLEKELPGIETLILNFKECDYVSSAGIRVLLSTYKILKAVKGQMMLKDVGENFKEVLENVGLDAVFDMC